MDSKSFESLYKLISSSPSTYLPPIALLVGVFLVLIATTTFKILGLDVQLKDSKPIRLIYALVGTILSVGALLFLSGFFKPSLTHFISSNDPSVLFQNGQILEELKDYNSALQAYSKAVTLNPKDPHDIWYRKGIVEFELGKYKDSANSSKEAFTAKPDSTDAAFLLDVFKN